jgi:phage terminase large subunit-like protein
LIVGEVNNGGDMVEHTLRTVDSVIPYKAVHASRGKKARAEPVAALYEQGKGHHVGTFPELEDQLCSWEPLSNDPSPDRMDALVWAASELVQAGRPNLRWLDMSIV